MSSVRKDHIKLAQVIILDIYCIDRSPIHEILQLAQFKLRNRR